MVCPSYLAESNVEKGSLWCFGPIVFVALGRSTFPCDGLDGYVVGRFSPLRSLIRIVCRAPLGLFELRPVRVVIAERLKKRDAVS
jgi:hypothetical protein